MMLPPSTVTRVPRPPAPVLLPGAPRIGTNVRLLLLRDGGCTPGWSLASSRKLRPFSGRFSICLCVMTPPTVCESYCICGAAPSTVTESLVSPMRNAKSAVVVVPVSTDTWRTMRWNPEASTLTSYSPAKSARETVVALLAEVVIVRVEPVRRADGLHKCCGHGSAGRIADDSSNRAGR